MISNKVLDVRRSFMVPFHVFVHTEPRSATHHVRICSAPAPLRNRCNFEPCQRVSIYPPSFHANTKCKFRNPFVLIFIQNARGCTPSHPFFISVTSVESIMHICKLFVFRSVRTLPFSVSRNPFACHSYENTGGVCQLFPFWFTPSAAEGNAIAISHDLAGGALPGVN
jgi:hypothetical protein